MNVSAEPAASSVPEPGAEFALQALARCRDALGLPPIDVIAEIFRAQPGDEERCLVARTLDCRADHERLEFDRAGDAIAVADALAVSQDGTWVNTPPTIVALQELFDDGLRHELRDHPRKGYEYGEVRSTLFRRGYEQPSQRAQAIIELVMLRRASR